jgi:hypothetical protein
LPSTRIESCKISRKTIKIQGMCSQSLSKDNWTHGCSHNEEGNDFGEPKLHGNFQHALISFTNFGKKQVLQVLLNRRIGKI